MYNNSTDEAISDEISTFIDGRYISGMEAAWRLQEFPICFRSHSVVRLAVHTENQQQLIFEEKNPSVSLDNWKTTLTAWFDLNKMDVFAKNINYINIPQYYVFNNQNKAWIKRQIYIYLSIFFCPVCLSFIDSKTVRSYKLKFCTEVSNVRT